MLGCAVGVLLCAVVTVVSSGSALRGSTSNSSTSVNLRVLEYDDDVDPPYVENLDPASGATLVPVTTNIVFHIKDFKNNDGVTAGSGVDLSTVVVTVTYGSTTNTYQSGSVALTASGISVNRTITINPETDFPNSTRVTVSVAASDLHSPANAMSTFRYSFLTVAASSPGSGSGSGPSGAVGYIQGNGGRRGDRTDILLDSLVEGDLLTIIERRRLPNNKVVERVLPRSEAKKIDKCYIDTTVEPLPFLDVPYGAWYEDALRFFLQMKVIQSGRFFGPHIGSTRAELAKMLVLTRGITPPPTYTSSFQDVKTSDPNSPYLEEAARQAWLRGYDNCYARTALCSAMPDQVITRAEAAAMILRFTQQQSLARAPAFQDVPAGAWYASIVGTAADHCILQGVGGSAIVQGERAVMRAELVMMLWRAIQNWRYGTDCGPGIQ